MRKNVLPLALCAFAAALLAAGLPEIEIRWDSKQLRVAAANLRLMYRKTVENLKSGESVQYIFRVALIDAEKRREDGSIEERMVVSYDLWEERYFASSRSRKGVSGRLKTPEQTERWMFDQLPMPPVDRERRYRLRIDIVRAQAQESNDENGLNLTRLVDLFSRKTENEPAKWSAESREFRLRDLETKPK